MSDEEDDDKDRLFFTKEDLADYTVLYNSLSHHAEYILYNICFYNEGQKDQKENSESKKGDDLTVNDPPVVHPRIGRRRRMNDDTTAGWSFSLIRAGFHQFASKRLTIESLQRRRRIFFVRRQDPIVTKSLIVT